LHPAILLARKTRPPRAAHRRGPIGRATGRAPRRSRQRTKVLVGNQSSYKKRKATTTRGYVPTGVAPNTPAPLANHASQPHYPNRSSTKYPAAISQPPSQPKPQSGQTRAQTSLPLHHATLLARKTRSLRLVHRRG